MIGQGAFQRPIRQLISRSGRRLFMATAVLVSGLGVSTTSTASPYVQAELDSMERLIEQLVFDMDRINNPPDHAVARQVASLPVCGSLSLTGDLSYGVSRSFDGNAKIRLDPSVIASVIGEADIDINLTPKGNISSSIGSSLRVCIDLMPWAQYAYYLMIDQDPDKEFWENSPLTFSERVAGASNGSGDLYHGISQPVVTFLAMLGDVVLGTADGVVNNPLFRSAIETTTAVLGNGVSEGEALTTTILSGLEGIGTNVEDQILSTVMGPFQASGDALSDMQSLVPFFPDMTGIAGQLNNLSLETLNPCDSAYASYDIPGILEDALDFACSTTETAIDISADVLHTFVSRAYEIGFVENRLADTRHNIIPEAENAIAQAKSAVNGAIGSIVHIGWAAYDAVDALNDVLSNKLETFFTDTIPSVFRNMTAWF